MDDTSLSTYWRSAGDQLGFRVVAPFTLNLGQSSIAVAALVPDFGAPNGMLITSKYGKIKPHLQWINANGYGFSVLSTKLAKPNAADVIAALEDWGWSGSGAEPAWLRKA